MSKRVIKTINGNEVDVTTVFDKSVRYTPTLEESNSVKAEVREILNTYFPDLLDEAEGLNVMFNPYGEFWNEKGWVIDAMKNHPFYNGNLQIVLKNQDLCRHINKADIADFRQYVRKTLNAMCTYKYNESIILDAEDLSRYINTIEDLIYYVTYEGNYDDYAERRRIYRILSNRCAKLYDLKQPKEFGFVKEAIMDICGSCEEDGTINVTEDMAERITRYANDYGVHFVMHEGEKITRLVLKLAKIIGIHKDVDIQDASFTRQDGVYVERTKDYGWNYQYAKFCDAISPIFQKGTIVFSVHPVDYYTMSFGKGWASCHTIDKSNIRGRELNGSHTYHGCYCGGTESYMLDNSSVIVYSLPNDFDGDHPELEDKIKRCVFYLGEDKLIQSRVYPDGRDGGDKSLAGDIRKSIQKLVSELWNIPNYWKNEKGTDVCADMIASWGVHYKDYESYDDCNVSFMKRIDGYKNENYINVGHCPICPECGEVHEAEDHIFCEEHNGTKKRCDDCGCYEDQDEMTYIPSRDIHICRHCRSMNYTYSDWVGEYIPNSEVVQTEEGRICLHGSDGYFECATCGENHNEEEEHYDPQTGGSYCETCYQALIERRHGNREE